MSTLFFIYLACFSVVQLISHLFSWFLSYSAGFSVTQLKLLYLNQCVFSQIFGVVIGSVSIYGIAEAQHQTSVHLFVVVLVFTIFMGLVSLANCMLSKGWDFTFQSSLATFLIYTYLSMLHSQYFLLMPL